MRRHTTLAFQAFVLLIAVEFSACGRSPATLTELERVRSGALDVVVLSPTGTLRRGKEPFTIEFRAASDGHLLDAGSVKASAAMPMPGMPMFGSINVQPGDVPGRYRAEGDFSMAGTWRVGIEFDGPAGKGSVSFSGNVQ